MTTSLPQISAKALSRRLQDDPAATVLDVRSRAEYRSGHIPGACLLPLDELRRSGDRDWLDSSGIGAEAPVYVTCHAGMRAEQAAQLLHAAGVEHAMLVRGGTEAWRKAGLPLQRCGTTLSLEQQVQITVGSMLVLKVFLGFAIHELFFVAAAAIGAGLIVTGMTRWGGMSALMSRMPWNRDRDCDRVAAHLTPPNAHAG